MKYLIFFSFAFILALSLFNFSTRKYTNPYIFEIMFGRKGCGKSTAKVKLAIHYHKRGWHVYTNVPDINLPFVGIFDIKQLGKNMNEFPEKTLLLIDEINLYWDNRSFKSFPAYTQEFLRQQRKLKIRIVGFSQTYDCDLKCKNLCDYLTICKKYFRVLSVSRRWSKIPDVVNANDYQDARITDVFHKIPIIAGGVNFTFIPKYSKFFDSSHVETFAER